MAGGEERRKIGPNEKPFVRTTKTKSEQWKKERSPPLPNAIDTAILNVNIGTSYLAIKKSIHEVHDNLVILLVNY